MSILRAFRRRFLRTRHALPVLAVMLAIALSHSWCSAARAQSSDPQRAPVGATAADDAPDVWKQLVRVVSLRDYNTRVVLSGTLLLGMAAGVVGTFMLLRKRALIGDVVGHASLPGIGVAFFVMEMITPGGGRWLPGLLLGALVAGLLAALCTVAIRRFSRIKEDATLAIVLSIFYGVGIALFTAIQRIPSGNKAGLQNFIYGQAHALGADDVVLIAQGAAVVLLLTLLLFKELSLLSFDEQFAAAQGWPVLALDGLLMLLVVGVTVIGLKTVGLLLVVALLIIPAAAARFWTDHLLRMTVISGLLGGVSACLGVLASAAIAGLAAGAVIVLSGSVLFLVSMLLGTQRGLLWRTLQHRRLKHRVGRHDLLRACYEAVEPHLKQAGSTADLTRHPLTFEGLLAMRSWDEARLWRLVHRALREGLLEVDGGAYRLTSYGAQEARRVARNHRLWEIYLITYADAAPSQVDRDADRIEHILDPELLKQLEKILTENYPHMAVPPSPHAIGAESELATQVPNP